MEMSKRFVRKCFGIAICGREGKGREVGRSWRSWSVRQSSEGLSASHGEL